MGSLKAWGCQCAKPLEWLYILFHESLLVLFLDTCFKVAKLYLFIYLKTVSKIKFCQALPIWHLHAYFAERNIWEGGMWSRQIYAEIGNDDTFSKRWSVDIKVIIASRPTDPEIALWNGNSTYEINCFRGEGSLRVLDKFTRSRLGRWGSHCELLCFPGDETHYSSTQSLWPFCLWWEWW